MSKDSEITDAAPPPKKKGKLKRLLVYGLGGALLLGGGVGAGLYAAGGMAGGHAAAEDPNKPKLVRKGEDGGGDSGDAKPAAKSEGHAPAKDEEGARPNPAEYQATYVPIEQPFTSNLQDSDGLIQVSLGVATFYDARVVDNLKRHEMPVRSAILMALADQDPVTLSSPEGKKALQRDLTAAINAVLRQKEGFGGIDDVYFSSFIIQ